MADLIATERSNIVAIADAVRNRTGESGDLTIDGIISSINGIEGGENLDAEIATQNAIIAEQDTKIAELAEVLAGKAGGGSESANIDTCTVTLNCFDNIYCLAYTAVENGKVIAKFLSSNDTTFILQNVICGSVITFFNNYDFNGFIHSHDSKPIGHLAMHMWCLNAPTIAGVDATITIFDND